MARRALGAILALSPVLLLFASIVGGIVGVRTSLVGGMAVMIPAAAIALLNFYLSFLRGRLYVRRHGSLDGYRYVSGLPIIGTVLVVIGALLGFGELAVAALGLVVMAADTGGSVWFLISTWRDASLWDA